MIRPTLSELTDTFWQAAWPGAIAPTDGSGGAADWNRGLAAVLTRLAEWGEDEGYSWLPKQYRAIASEADPQKTEPDTKALKAAALEVRDESDATMRHIKAMNAAMDAVIAALPGGKR
jgi:hypothetical protein